MKGAFPLLRRFFCVFKVHDFHHISSLPLSSSLTLLPLSHFFSLSPISVVVVSFSVLCRCCVVAAGAALLLLVLVLVVVCVVLRCCSVLEQFFFFSLLPLVFSVTQAIAEYLSGALFCAARSVPHLNNGEGCVRGIVSHDSYRGAAWSRMPGDQLIHFLVP